METKKAAPKQKKKLDNVKYVSLIPEFNFMIPLLDKKGEQVFGTDASGNNKLPKWKEVHFSKVQVRNPKTGVVDTRAAYCMLVVTRKEHGDDFDRIIARVEQLKKNPMYKLYNNKEHRKLTNPEAYAITEQIEAKDEVIAEQNEKLTEKDEYIKSLEEKLGFANKEKP